EVDARTHLENQLAATRVALARAEGRAAG
ncbi:MAG: hypothetical protein JWP93_2023, partial [Polaromonas sp.]|nr:hypothetical protein [Polaromonas sp.]